MGAHSNTEDKKKQAEQRAVEQKRAVEAQQELARAYREVLSSKAGVAVLQDIMKECGYKDPVVVRGASHNVVNGQVITSYGDVMPNSTIYNGARRDVWCNIRTRIPPELLNKIEMEKAPVKKKPRTEEDES